jgi:hypothetical protein
MGEVQPTFARNKKLPPDGRFAVIKRDLQASGGRDFCRAETRRSAADDGQLRMSLQGSDWIDR